MSVLKTMPVKKKKKMALKESVEEVKEMHT